jgi:hypothetical protein
MRSISLGGLLATLLLIVTSGLSADAAPGARAIILAQGAPPQVCTEVH